jgi:predicted nucleic acid-binding protein
MIVISNTSPLTNLAAIGQFELLHLLFDEIWIPEGV